MCVYMMYVKSRVFQSCLCGSLLCVARYVCECERCNSHVCVYIMQVMSQVFYSCLIFASLYSIPVVYSEYIYRIQE